MKIEHYFMLSVAIFCGMVLYLLFRKGAKNAKETLYNFEDADFYDYNEAKRFYFMQVLKGVEGTKLKVYENCKELYNGLASEYFTR
jgi:hypothetical protein